MNKKILLFGMLILLSSASVFDIRTSRNGCFINTMQYRQYIIHERPPQTIVRCFCMFNDGSGGNCVYKKKPINADKLPFRYWVR